MTIVSSYVATCDGCGVQIQSSTDEARYYDVHGTWARLIATNGQQLASICPNCTARLSTGVYPLGPKA